MSSPNSKPRKDAIYRMILGVLVLDVMIGAILTLVGELVFHDPGISLFGTLLAIVGGVLYACFRWLGRREARRRQ